MTDYSADHESIDIGKQQVGSIYAKALLGACQSTGSATEVLDQLQQVVRQLLPNHPKFATLLESVQLKADDKIALLDRVFQGKMHATLLTFLKVVASHGRLDCLTEILHASQQLFDQQRGVVTVHVTAAFPLDESLQRRITEKLQTELGHEVTLHPHVDRSLIGGLVVRVGDKVYDGSVANQLRTLRTEALDKSVQQMRAASDRFMVAT